MIGKITILIAAASLGLIGSAHAFIDIEGGIQPIQYDGFNMYIYDSIWFRSSIPHSIGVTIYAYMEPEYLVSLSHVRANFTLSNEDGLVRESTANLPRWSSWGGSTAAAFDFFYDPNRLNNTDFVIRFVADNGIDDTIKFRVTLHEDFYPRYMGGDQITNEAIRENHRIYTERFAEQQAQIDRLETLVAELFDRVRAMQKLINTITDVVFR